jgi:hypothetical protein
MHLQKMPVLALLFRRRRVTQHTADNSQLAAPARRFEAQAQAQARHQSPYAIAVDTPKTDGTELRPSLDSDSSLLVCFTLRHLGLWGCRAVVALWVWALELELWKLSAVCA